MVVVVGVVVVVAVTAPPPSNVFNICACAAMNSRNREQTWHQRNERYATTDNERMNERETAYKLGNAREGEVS